MGHLINPSAMRIGKFKYWEDLWYKESNYYPEFLHTIFKMRLFLISFFSFHLFESKNIFYSHFYFVKQNKTLIVQIFLYQGKMEVFLNNFFIKNNFVFNKIFSSFFFNAIAWDKKYIIYLNILIYLNIFFKIKVDSLNKDFFIILFKFLNKEYSLKFLLRNKVITKDFKVFFIFFYRIANTLNTDISIILKLFFILLFKYSNLIPFYKHLALFIKNIFYNFFDLKHLSISIYLVSNENLNAKFLARFIARKLQQGYSIRHVVTPIIKDLLITIKDSSLKYDEDLISNAKNVKIAYKKFLQSYYNLYKDIYNLQYLNNFFILTIEDYIYIIKIKHNLEQTIYRIVLLRKFWTNKYLWSFYLNYNKFFYFWNKKHYQRHLFFEHIFSEKDSSYNIFFKQHFFLLNEKLINLSYFFLNLFLKLNYMNYSFFKLLNLKNKKINLKKKDLAMLGFKFHFLGRFSRRQRASSIWFMEGQVTLNTLSANIEYSYYTIPLFNSAVRIKVFINRGDSYKEFFLQII